MFQQYFHQKDLVTLPILTMLLFGVVFLSVLVRALRQRPSEALTHLPLREERAETGGAAGAGGDHV